MPSASLPRPAGAGGATGVLLVAHGSRHAAVAPALEEQCRLLQVELADRGLPCTVHGGFLDHATPDALDAGSALVAEAGCREVVLLPLLLTEAFHTGHDIPELAARLRERLADTDVVVGPHLGRHPQLLEDARKRVHEAVAGGVDGVVVALTGTSHRAELDAQRQHVVDGLGDVAPAGRVAVTVLTAAGPGPRDAVVQLRDTGATSPSWLSWSLLPGTLADAGLAEARAVAADLVDLGRLGPSPTVAGALADRLVMTHRSTTP